MKYLGTFQLKYTFGNDIDISDSSYDVMGFIKKMVQFQPKYIAFNGKKSASFFLGYRGVTSLVDFGLQDKRIGTSQIYILPSTSGSARRYCDESYWIDLYERIRRS